MAMGETVRNLLRGSADRGALRLPKLLILYEFMRHRHCAYPAEISDALMWEPSRTAKDIKGLVESGHLQPVPRSNESRDIDGRLRRYSLTAEGFAQAERFLGALQAIDVSLMPLVSVHAGEGTRHLHRQLALAAQTCGFESTSSIDEAIRQGHLKKVRRYS